MYPQFVHLNCLVKNEEIKDYGLFFYSYLLHSSNVVFLKIDNMVHVQSVQSHTHTYVVQNRAAMTR